MDSQGMPPEVDDELQEEIESPKSVDSTYEEIDAPKFFDFTVPDHPSCADDGRSWFCARIGCDQVHEEVDLDAMNKSFLHRVVAARSPNVRYRKALDRQASSSHPKFPQSAPAKSTQSMLVKLSAMTSIPEKMAEVRLKDHPIASFRSVSNLVKARAEPCSSKEETSLISQRSLANQERIQSMKHQKEPVGDVKNSTMSKAVPFLSSDSGTIISTKETSEATSPSNCNVPESEVCPEKKNLIAGRRMKYVPSRYLCTSATWKKSKTTEDPTKTTKKDRETKRTTKLASTTSSKLDVKADKGFDGQSVTATEFEEHLTTLAVNSDKNSTDIKSDTISKLTELTVLQGSTREDSSVMEVDREWGCQRAAAAKDEEHFATLAVNSATVYPKLKCLDSADVNSISSMTIREMENLEKDIGKICLTCASNKVDIGAQNKDDKENASYNNCGRFVTLNTQNLESKSFNSANIENTPQKVLIPQIKSSNETSDRGKHTKTTNPRPFRLRVDERKILKEANHERLEIEALKKSKTNIWCRNVIKSVITKEKTTEKIQSRLLKPSSRQTLKPRSMAASRKAQDDNTETVVPGKLSSRQPLERRSVTASRKPPDYSRETVTTAVTLKGRTASRKSLDPKIARANKNIANTALILRGRTTSRKPPNCKIARDNREAMTTALTLDVWKRLTTVPKEPNFHKIHLPKDCTKRKAQVQIR